MCSQLKDVIVVDVHSFRRLSLVLARPIVIALIIVKLVRFRTRTLTCTQNVLRALSRPQHASSSVFEKRRRTIELNYRQKVLHLPPNNTQTKEFSTSNDRSSSSRNVQWVKASLRRTKLCNSGNSAAKASVLRSMKTTTTNTRCPCSRCHHTASHPETFHFINSCAKLHGKIKS